MAFRSWAVLFVVLTAIFAAVSAYSVYGAPVLPPLGAPAQHPVYRYGKTDYLTALRYDSINRSPYRVESAYAYQVDGQTVKVAKVDNADSGYY